MKILTATACVFFLTFAVMRALRVPFTYDEAASYIRYIDTSASSDFDTTSLSVFNFEVATNHFLNTVLARLAYLAAGNAELILRMPSLIGYALYLSFGWMLLNQLANRAIRFAGFLLLNLNPYLLDFFALSRGYGLSIGLLMGALYFLCRFLDAIPRDDPANRQLTRAFGFACAAVLANFATLNVYVGCWATAVIAIVAVSVTKRSLGESRVPEERRRSGPMVLLLMAVIFTALVFSQDVRLSRTLYEPVTVRLSGFDQSALDRTSVIQVDLRGRQSRLLHDVGTPVWRSIAQTPVRRLRIEVPRDDAGKLARIETTFGTRASSFDSRRPDAWTNQVTSSLKVFESSANVSLARSRIPGFQSVINWSGDAVYLQRLSVSVASALAVFMGFAALLTIGAKLVEHAHLFTPAQSRILVEAILWVAVLAGPPLYILERNRELYFGGTEGLFTDTFQSLIASTAYGRLSTPYQIQLVSAGVVTVLALAIGAFLLMARFHGRRWPLTRPSVLLVILLTASFSLVVQHIAFQTVYLTGRTALFFIPLCTLFLIYVCDVLASRGLTARVIATSLATAAVLIAALHFARTANLRYVFDWPDDASTKRMIEDVRQFAAKGPDPVPVTLGVEPRYAPVAFYYARRSLASHIEVVVLPSPRPCDFLYVRESAGVTNVIGRYASTRSVLMRVP